ncbi:hypothetical protein WMF31_40720 [Sorangium sp. So ce1036]|uniref:hypothetical protein n=1 Tax=Sorangium sp. So ce1036 TaxID=3133328 RepID=UPI003EFD411B
MRYRDERDALRGRVDSLEQQLATARKELEAQRDDDRAARVEQIERQMAEARRVLDQLGRELDEVRGRPRRPSVAPRVALLGVVVCSGIAGVLLIARRPSPTPTFLPTFPPTPAPPRPTTPVPSITPPDAEPTAQPPEAEPTAAPAPERPLRTARATWKATVTRATGLPLAAGATCTIEATLTSAGDDIHVPGLEVVCRGTPIYRSSDELSGMSMFRSGVEEDSGPAPGTTLYAISYEDKGARAGARAEISLDSVRKAGLVWRDAAPAYRVELAIPYQSAPVKGEPLLDATGRALRASARVTDATGPSPVKVGARCTLRASPLARPGKCLTRLECGGRMLYGAGTTGVSACTVVGDQVVRVHDGNTSRSGGDPALDLDVSTGRITVRDEVGSAAWTVGMTLDPSG